MRNMFVKKSKKGITLVESVFAVVILATLTIGVITLLTSGGVKIQEISNEADAYSQAVQKMDLIISAVSNGSSKYIVTTDSIVSLDVKALLKTLGYTEEEANRIAPNITVEQVLYDTNEDYTILNTRGWFLEVTEVYADPNSNNEERTSTVTVKGFVSNSEGVFDRDDA